MRDPAGRLLVTGQFAAIAYLLATTHWPSLSWGAGLLLGSSLFLAAWSFSALRPGSFNIRPALRKGARLVKSGPYRYVRNPMYGSVLLAGGGVLFVNCSLWRALTGLLLTLIVLVKVWLEERLLAEKFGADYESYKARTGLFLPTFWLRR
ncbi:MAG: isoprenylcysteine carboxylmethyltransferase family protein [Thermodesulfobacteriota bacterium]